jgi:hypothetical protein
MELVDKVEGIAEHLGLKAALVCLPGQHKQPVDIHTMVAMGDGNLPVGWTGVPGRIVFPDEALVPHAVYDPSSDEMVPVCYLHYTEFTGEEVPDGLAP